MRNILMIAAIAGLATAATATPTTHHKRATDNGAAAVRELNEKSLQQASAGSTGAAMAPTGAPMSDSGSTTAPASANGSMSSPAATPTDAAPMAPTTPAPPQ